VPSWVWCIGGRSWKLVRYAGWVISGQRAEAKPEGAKSIEDMASLSLRRQETDLLIPSGTFRHL